MNFFRIFEVIVRLRKIFETFDEKFWRIQKIVLRCALSQKILKKCMVIYGKKIHFWDFFQNLWSSVPFFQPFYYDINLHFIIILIPNFIGRVNLILLTQLKFMKRCIDAERYLRFSYSNCRMILGNVFI